MSTGMSGRQDVGMGSAKGSDMGAGKGSMGGSDMGSGKASMSSDLGVNAAIGASGKQAPDMSMSGAGAKGGVHNHERCARVCSMEGLKQAITRGERFDFLVFEDKKGDESRRGMVDENSFSNRYNAGFEAEGKMFPTAEHWLMWNKARMFNDEDAARRILETKDPLEAKRIGRMVKNFDERVWNDRAHSIAVDGMVRKFRANPELRRFLLSTGDKVLVKADKDDTKWGVGMDKDKVSNDPSTWRGKNMLGFALMEARTKLCCEEKPGMGSKAGAQCP